MSTSEYVMFNWNDASVAIMMSIDYMVNEDIKPTLVDWLAVAITRLPVMMSSIAPSFPS